MDLVRVIVEDAKKDNSNGFMAVYECHIKNDNDLIDFLAEIQEPIKKRQDGFHKVLSSYMNTFGITIKELSEKSGFCFDYVNAVKNGTQSVDKGSYILMEAILEIIKQRKIFK